MVLLYVFPPSSPEQLAHSLTANQEQMCKHHVCVVGLHYGCWLLDHPRNGTLSLENQISITLITAATAKSPSHFWSGGLTDLTIYRSEGSFSQSFLGCASLRAELLLHQRTEKKEQDSACPARVTQEDCNGRERSPIFEESNAVVQVEPTCHLQTGGSL